GLVSDSYAAGVGSDGPFTGAAVYLGYVMFFKERCVHKVFGNKPANFQIITSNIRGVAAGASASLCVIDEILYYAGNDGIMSYDGSVPETVSDPLGKIDPSSSVAVANGKYFYLSVQNGVTRDFYVLDTKRSVWHRYSPVNVTAMAPASCGVLAAADGALYVIDPADSGEAASDITGFHDRETLYEKWYFETGELTAEREDCYVNRIEITAKVPAGGELSLELIGGESEVTPVITLRGGVRRTFTIPVVTSRQRRFRLRISGKGRAVIYSITKFIEKC
ncbi:MAG: hypothetical protein IKN38_10615, partial [Clostridia bacterium]|nr:hypothetical protein [Clostridia bacterium]